MKSNGLALLKQDKPYTKLLQHILIDNDYYSKSVPLPSIKELAKALGLNYAELRRQILEVYDDLGLGDEVVPTFSFPKVRYTFMLRGMTKDKYLYLEVDQLPVMPRVGENINLPFFSAYMRTTQFYVENVEHEFTDGLQEVVFSLREGYFNSYWHYRKDKALEEDEIDILEYYRMDKYDLKKRLNVGRRWY
ncbi:hypothetical protein D1627_02095 [Pontibacter oryzae]|uniref:Uncharacterized protein n=2 Tax=Pontibacter oryzae TaxID=2304593 RepID=A0A399SIF7_9BACT|nr:hypothetical protein D1627_02095 [Pontibacter oryzae]